MQQPSPIVLRAFNNRSQSQYTLDEAKVRFEEMQMSWTVIEMNNFIRKPKYDEKYKRQVWEAVLDDPSKGGWLCLPSRSLIILKRDGEYSFFNKTYQTSNNGIQRPKVEGGILWDIKNQAKSEDLIKNASNFPATKWMQLGVTSDPFILLLKLARRSSIGPTDCDDVTGEVYIYYIKSVMLLPK